MQNYISVKSTRYYTKILFKYQPRMVAKVDFAIQHDRIKCATSFQNRCSRYVYENRDCYFRMAFSASVNQAGFDLTCARSIRRTYTPVSKESEHRETGQRRVTLQVRYRPPGAQQSRTLASRLSRHSVCRSLQRAKVVCATRSVCHTGPYRIFRRRVSAAVDSFSFFLCNIM